jgi:hypothetical protein
MSVHNDKTTRCYHDSTDDVDIDVDDDLQPTTLTFEDHGRYVKHPNGVDDRGTRLRERFTHSALRFDCPDCKRRHYMCPVCSDPDEHTPPGWFYGESTGKQLACPCCNAAEAARQKRSPYA